MKTFEHERNAELSEAKKELLALEATGKYLFHGSPFRIDELEPRQPHTVIKPGSYEVVPDGNPGVSASPYAEIAIFRAIINRVNIPENHTASFGSHSDEQDGPVTLSYGMTSNVLDHINESAGYVYVLDRQYFQPRAGEKDMEWRSDTAVKPMQVIEVHEQDLPSSIEIRDHLQSDETNKTTT